LAKPRIADEVQLASVLATIALLLMSREAEINAISTLSFGFSIVIGYLHRSGSARPSSLVT
jgi:hypothetical protein